MWPWRVAFCNVLLCVAVCVAVCVAACCITGVAVCCDVAVASRVLQCGAVYDAECCSVLQLQTRHWYILQIDLVLSWDCATWSGSANVCVWTCVCVWEREREREWERVRKYVLVRVRVCVCVCANRLGSFLGCVPWSASANICMSMCVCEREAET